MDCEDFLIAVFDPSYAKCRRESFEGAYQGRDEKLNIPYGRSAYRESENFPYVKLGRGVKLFAFVNLYGCDVGDQTRIGCFVEIQRGAKIGARCKISSHTFICGGVTIEDEVFVGHGVMFTNDRWPRAATSDGVILGDGDWKSQPTLVKKGASIGSGSTILCGLTIGENAMIGAGSVVTTDIPAGATVVGNPARPTGNSKKTHP